MKKVPISIVLILVLALALQGCVSDNNSSSQGYEATATSSSNELKTKLDNIVNACDFKGVACVYDNGNKIYEFTSGQATENTENSVQEVYRCGSLTKQFTAVAIMKLYEENKLNLTDNISKYFEGYDLGDKITIDNLLSMTSGIPDYSASRGESERQYTNEEIHNMGMDLSSEKSSAENEQIIESWILSQDLTFEPSSEFEYSNSNYFLLGKIIESVSKTSYIDYITDNIITPLGLSSTSFDSKTLTTAGYIYDSTATEQSELKSTDLDWITYPGVFFASSDINSNADDLYTWITSLKNEKIISKQNFDLMIEDKGNGYGYGFMVNDKIAYHTGEYGAYTSFIGFTINQDIVAISLSNTFKNDDNYKSVGLQLGFVAYSYLYS